HNCCGAELVEAERALGLGRGEATLSRHIVREDWIRLTVRSRDQTLVRALKALAEALGDGRKELRGDFHRGDLALLLRARCAVRLAEHRGREDVEQIEKE